MASFLLVPGAGGGGWSWRLVAAELRALGHDAVCVDLPATDPEVGLAGYRRRILLEAERRKHQALILVGHSLGAFSVPLACDALEVTQIVLVNGMVPAPAESAGDWWGAVGWQAAADAAATRDGRARPDISDAETLLLHDLLPELRAEIRSRPRPFGEAPRVFEEPWPRESWPDVPTRLLASVEDRLFPLELQRRIAEERLGLPITAIPGGHMAPLSQPRIVAAALTTE